jgi:glycine cleavage system H protein
MIGMTEYLETTVDKFIFRVATDRYYSSEGLWAKADGKMVRIGLTDFWQQRHGDVAFAEIEPVGSALNAEDVISTIETIKVDIELTSPLSGTIVEVNPDMEDRPELINQDPYGQGWLALIEVADWETEKDHLMDPQAYFTLMKGQAEEEAKQP